MIPPVVPLSWVEDRPGRVVLADVRWYLDGRSGRDAYDQGHIPGAVFVDLDRWLAGPAGPAAGRHPLPDPATFAEGMSSVGIGDGSIVVGYDDQGGVIAARLVWMLRATGHDAALLDGGIQSYQAPLQQGPPTDPTTAGSCTPRPWPAERLAGIDDASDPANLVIDARAPERFSGEDEPIDPRPGHIPGARNLPCRSNLDPQGRFLPVDVLRSRFESVGVTAASGGASVVSYCGSGVTACHNLIALELAGMGRGRLYPGSWSQYSHDRARPVETGAGSKRWDETPPTARNPVRPYDRQVLLSPEEGRVVGSLIEKQLTTPQQYPLTMNALLLACNQSSNRDPVVGFDERTVDGALTSLKGAGVVRFVHPSHGRSVTRYRQVLEETLGLGDTELALVGVLLLRGPQTAGELRSRTERMAQFEGIAAVEAELERLAARPDPLARKLGRRPGQKEERWIQLLTDQIPDAEPRDGPEAASDRHVDRTDPAGDQRAEDRMDRMDTLNRSSGPWVALQDEVSELRAEVDQLRSALDDLRTQLGS